MVHGGSVSMYYTIRLEASMDGRNPTIRPRYKSVQDNTELEIPNTGL